MFEPFADNIVPTSGMRGKCTSVPTSNTCVESKAACTAVVTELAYHQKNTIDADISFLSELEWRQELAVLLQDLVDEDGNIKRTMDLKSDAGVAWQKVQHTNTSTIKNMNRRLTRMFGPGPCCLPDYKPRAAY